MKIALLGDIALLGRYDRTITEDVDRRIQYVKELVSDCDFVIGNLETPLTSKTGTIACKGVYLKSDPVNVGVLKEMGVTHVTLANNHVYDYGARGVDETIDTLKKENIGFVGLGNRPAKLIRDQEKVLLEGFCCLSANAICYGDRPGRVKLLTPDSLENFLKTAADGGFLPIASVHFGIEGVHYPSTEHIQLFRSMAEKYPYILHGNHPHAVQGYEKVKDALLIYAQGNLCFDKIEVTSLHLKNYTQKPEARRSYISVIEIRDNAIVRHDVYPVTDLDTGMLHKDDCLSDELREYCDALSESVTQINDRRKMELSAQKQNAAARDIRFFIDRINYKYIGAYLNGKMHARKYKEIMKNYTVNKDSAE